MECRDEEFSPCYCSDICNKRRIGDVYYLTCENCGYLVRWSSMEECSSCHVPMDNVCVNWKCDRFPLKTYSC